MKILLYAGGALALYLLLQPSSNLARSLGVRTTVDGGLLGSITRGISGTSGLLNSIFGTSNSPPSTSIAPGATGEQSDGSYVLPAAEDQGVVGGSSGDASGDALVTDS